MLRETFRILKMRTNEVIASSVNVSKLAFAGNQCHSIRKWFGTAECWLDHYPARLVDVAPSLRNPYRCEPITKVPCVVKPLIRNRMANLVNKGVLARRRRGTGLCPARKDFHVRAHSGPNIGARPLDDNTSHAIVKPL